MSNQTHTTKMTVRIPLILAALSLVSACAGKSAPEVAAAPAPTAEPEAVLQKVVSEQADAVTPFVQVRGTDDRVDALLDHTRGVVLDHHGLDEDDHLHLEAMAEILRDTPDVTVAIQPARANLPDEMREIEAEIIGLAHALEIQQALVDHGAPASQLRVLAADDELELSIADRAGYTDDASMRFVFEPAPLGYVATVDLEVK
jgi:hypothetical protein